MGSIGKAMGSFWKRWEAYGKCWEAYAKHEGGVGKLISSCLTSVLELKELFGFF